MVLTLVHFDRIFDVVPGARGYRDAVTQFSFESDDKRHLCVTVRGLEEVKLGMTVIALLKRNDDWRSLQGWINCSDGRVVYGQCCSSPLANLSLALLMVAFMPLFWLSPIPRQGLAQEILTAIFSVTMLVSVYGFVRSLIVKRTLLSAFQSRTANRGVMTKPIT